MNPLQLRQQTATTNVAEKTQDPTIAKAGSEARTAAAGAGSAELKFDTEKLNAIASRQSSLANNPLLINAENNPEFAEANKQKISDLFLNYGRTEASNLKIPKEQADQLIQPYLDVAINQPAGSRRFVIERMLSGMDHAARAQIMQPSGVKTSTGAVDQVVATNIYGSQTPGTPIPGTQAIQEPGPTTELIAVEGDGTGLTPGTKYLKGAQGPKPATAPPPGRMVTGNAPATQALLAAAGTVAGPDWVQTVQDASTAQSRIGLFQDIKKYAPEAFTGVGGERKALAAGIARIVGIDAYTAEQTATEQLSKNACWDEWDL